MNASPAVLSSCPKTVVIGAGVIGLGIAWRLAQAGCKVSVYDRAAAGGGASRAAAGMLAAAVETEPGEERLLTLTLESQRLWPDFARELEAASGIAVEYRDEGTMVVALTRDDTAQLRHNYEFQKALGLDLEWLSGAEARRREPHLRPGLPAAVLSPRDHQVDNRRLAAALALALRGAGGVLHEHCPVREVTLAGDRVCGVVTAAGPEAADVVVLAAGAADQGSNAGPWHGRNGAAIAPCDLGAQGLSGAAPRRPAGDRRHRRGARLRREPDGGRSAGASRRRLAGGAGDRRTAGHRDLGRLSPGLAR